jgi:uncharacterized protein YifE (UPF0438 family)
MKNSTIRKIKNSPEGLDLIKFIIGLIRDLDRVSDIPKSWSKEQKAIEITARRHAIDKLKKILEPIDDFQDIEKDNENEYLI